MYCRSDFVAAHERSCAERTIMHIITGICLVLVTAKLSFSGNVIIIYSEKPAMAQEEELLRAVHLLLNVISNHKTLSCSCNKNNYILILFSRKQAYYRFQRA